MFINIIMAEININHVVLWNKNPLFNPLTKRKIKKDGPVYKKYSKLYKKYKLDKINSPKKVKDRYYNLRENIIDPILLTNLPLFNKRLQDLFCFKFKWNPYNGERLGIDHDGPLYFDPNTLIHYFYTNRLTNLWTEGGIEGGMYYEGHYGDAVGNGPEFEIKGRGSHKDWYLFRLPIIDCYLDNFNTQAVTMGPILTDNEIKEIYKLSKRYGRKYKEMYGYNRPNILKIKELYDIAVSKNLHINMDFLSLQEINIIKYQINIDAVENLKLFK